MSVSDLTAKERMVILNFKGTVTDESERAFCKLLGIDAGDLAWNYSSHALIKIAHELKGKSRGKKPRRKKGKIVKIRKGNS